VVPRSCQRRCGRRLDLLPGARTFLEAHQDQFLDVINGTKYVFQTNRSLRARDDCTLNTDSSLWCDTFEDGTFMSDRIRVGDRCTLRSRAFVLYGATLAKGSALDADSLLVKGEEVLPSAWCRGKPVREIWEAMAECPRPAAPGPAPAPLPIGSAVAVFVVLPLGGAVGWADTVGGVGPATAASGRCRLRIEGGSPRSDGSPAVGDPALTGPAAITGFGVAQSSLSVRVRSAGSHIYDADLAVLRPR